MVKYGTDGGHEYFAELATNATPNFENYEKVRENQMKENDKKMRALGIIKKAKQLQQLVHCSPRNAGRSRQQITIESRPTSARRKLVTGPKKENEVVITEQSNIVGSNQLNMEASSTTGEKENTKKKEAEKKSRGSTRGIKLAKKESTMSRSI
ncbi:hypothetical protein Cni_G20133 [Canna indica]|uniref:Uncharacterized protein n=1 Tax=Canna indica TaxID=4628 RepID=A0AAQ3QJ72_9LILI|nr:hypothetical protein Cni_G20133 [Canna indica]